MIIYKVCVFVFYVLPYAAELKALKSRRKELTPIEDADDLEPEERQRIEQLEQKMYDPVCSTQNTA